MKLSFCMGIGAMTLQHVHLAACDIYTEGDTSGCGRSNPFNDITTYHTLISGGVRRKYGIHTPSNYSENHQHPLIVGFHGYPNTGFFFEADTRLDDAKYTADKIMVYPDGIGNSWAGANYSSATVAQDLQFVWDMLADIRGRYCVDSARIYATGWSNGGGFVGTLACNDTVGGEFAAFAPASGAFYTDSHGPDGNGCNPARDLVPILEFHGGADDIVLYDGGQGEGGYEPPIADWVSWWAQRNVCNSPEQRDSFGNDVHHLIYDCQGQYGAVQHYKTDDQKHDWASTEPNLSQFAALDKPTHIEASRIIQEFFMNFTRPSKQNFTMYYRGKTDGQEEL